MLKMRILTINKNKCPLCQGNELLDIYSCNSTLITVIHPSGYPFGSPIFLDPERVVLCVKNNGSESSTVFFFFFFFGWGCGVQLFPFSSHIIFSYVVDVSRWAYFLSPYLDAFSKFCGQRPSYLHHVSYSFL